MKMTRRHMTSAGAAAAAATVLMASASSSNAGGPEVGAVDAPNQFVEVGGRKLAYRSVGEGKPIVLLNRFRGTLDTWDPAFIDALAAEGFQVLYFDYSGLGLSTGEKSYNPANLVKDAREFILALGLKDVAIGGWSIGGIAAQIYLAMFGAEVSHAILLATTPPGQLVKSGEKLFYDLAAQQQGTLDQFTTIFHEPRDEGSKASALASIQRLSQRTKDRSPDVDAAWGISQIGTEPRNPVFPSEDVLNVLKTTRVPVLHLGADRDIIFPIENWYALNGLLSTTRLVTYPRTGHGPQQQYPEEVARDIAAFIKSA